MKIKKLFLLVCILLSASILLAACTPQDAPPQNVTRAEIAQEDPTDVPEPTEDPQLGPLELTDGLGRVVTLAEPAQRVVGLAPSNIEILFAVGAGPQVVGREDFANYPAEALDLPSVGGSFGDLNIEAILGLEPDLVLVADLTTAEQIQALEDVGLTVFMLANPTDLEGMYGNLRTTAQLTGHTGEVETVIEQLQDRVDAVLTIVANADSQPTVFYELDSTDPNAPWTAGAGTFIDTLIALAGGQNIGASYEGAWVQLSSEEILVQDPGIIVLGDSIWGVTPEDVAARAGWDALAAVQNGQVFAFNDDLVSRPGPRLVEGLEELARLIHPELFE